MHQHSAPVHPAPLLLRPFAALLAHRHPTAAGLLVAVPSIAAAVFGGIGEPLLIAPAALLAALATSALAWLGGQSARATAEARAATERAEAEREAAVVASAERLEEQVRGAFVQQQFTEKQSRIRAQEIVDDSSAGIVQRLAEVEGQVGSVQASTDVIDDKALAATSATREILVQAEQADADVAALEESLRSVESMATVIAQVADQTKLLALNATIEAARAGAAGDGFRVVAAEVKNLAATTAGSTQEIATTVAAVQANAQAVLRSLRAVQERLSGIDDAAAGLRSVASEQRNVLIELQGSVAAAVDGARQMSDLADVMERRRTSRHSCRQALTLRVAGQEHPATALDLGLGGARATTESTQRIGVGTRVVLHWPYRGSTLDLAGAVARTSGQPGAYDLGIVFDASGANAPAALVDVIDQLQAASKAATTAAWAR